MHGNDKCRLTWKSSFSIYAVDSEPKANFAATSASTAVILKTMFLLYADHFCPELFNRTF